MKPSQVTEQMKSSFLAAWFARKDKESAVTPGIAAALTAMPDDLLRELARERGCMMVPAEKFKRWMYLAEESRSLLIDHEMNEFLAANAVPTIDGGANHD